MGYLLIDGQLFKEADFLEKVQNRYWGLHNYLIKETNCEVYILPIIVFSDDRTKVRFGLQKINHTYVINKQWLLKTIDQNQWHKYQEQKEVINDALKKLTSTPQTNKALLQDIS